MLSLFATDASSPVAFVRESDGLRLRDGTGLALRGGIDLRISSHFSGEIEGQIERAGERGPTIGRPTRAALQWTGERHRLLVGRRPSRWGAADGGDLLLGRSARARWGLAWSTARPLDLPVLPEDFGAWSGDAFCHWLDDDARTIADPLLLGHRLAWEPHRFLQLGFSRTILFGGRGRASKLTARDLLGILLAIDENQKGERPPSDSDQKAALFARLTVPALGPLRDLDGFYVYAGEDALHGVFPSAAARQFGGGAALGRFAARLEVTDTVTGANRWYSHTVYGDAYFYRRLPMGWPYGAGADIVSGTCAVAAGRWIFGVRTHDERMVARDGRRSHRTRAEAWLSLALGTRGRLELGIESVGASHLGSVFQGASGSEPSDGAAADSPLDPLDPIGVRQRVVLTWTQAWGAVAPTTLLPLSIAHAFGIATSD